MPQGAAVSPIRGDTTHGCTVGMCVSNLNRASGRMAVRLQSHLERHEHLRLQQRNAAPS